MMEAGCSPAPPYLNVALTPRCAAMKPDSSSRLMPWAQGAGRRESSALGMTARHDIEVWA